MKTYQNNPKFKVAIIRPDCSVLPREFYNSQELGLATGLSNLNIDVDVFYAGNVKNVTYEQVNSNKNGLVRLIQLPFVNLPLIGQGFYPHLTKELCKNQYDLIQVNEYNDITNYVTVKYAHKNKIPVIIYQGMYKNLSGRVNQVYTKLHDFLALPALKKYVSATYGKTIRAAKFLESKGFVKPSVLPVGLEPSPFDNPNFDVKFDKDQLGIPQAHTVITYIGNFEPRRNISFLLELAHSLKDNTVSFVFVGAGEQFDEATCYKETHNLSNLLILNRIPQTEISQIYALSDIFLLASDYEIYGMVLIEAMYNGVVPISNISAGSESLISHGKDGLLLDNLNVGEWKDNVMRLIDNSEVLNSMKVSAKKKISSTLTWEKVAQYYNEEIITPLRVKHD